MQSSKYKVVVLTLLFALVGAGCVEDTPSTPVDPDAKPWFLGKSDNTQSGSSCQGPLSAPPGGAGPNAQMEYVNICGPAKTGGTICRCISRLVMGTDHLGNFWQQWGFPEGKYPTPAQQRKADARKMLDYAVAKGINLFDTAPIYVEGIENTLGAWIKDRKQADPNLKLYTLTKGGFPFDVGPGSYDSRLRGSQKDIVRNIAEELRWSYPNLDGQIDFYLMHRDDIRFVDYQDRTYADVNGNPRTQTPVETILGALSDTTPYGDIPHLGGRSLRDHYTWIGVSNWTTSRVGKALSAAKKDPKLLRPLINSPYFSLFEMSGQYTIHSGGVEVTHKEMMDPRFQKGILLMPYSPLGGFPIIDKGTAAQNGKDAWDNARKVAKSLDHNRDRYWGNVYEALFTPENEQRFYRVHAIAQAFTLEGKRYSIDQWLNAYVLAHPRTDLLAVGPIKKEHIDRTADTFALARALRRRHDLLDWLYEGKLADLPKLPRFDEAKMQRTAILIYGLTQPGQDMFIRGGIDHGYAKSALGRDCTAQNMRCALPIRHLNVDDNANRRNDHFLDWYGAEAGQSAGAEGSPAAWTTDHWPSSWGDAKYLDQHGFGEWPLNSYGQHYWLLDVMMDCSKAANGWFEFKTYISNGPGWEGDIQQPSAPYGSNNHFARCGKLNVYRRNQDAPVTITDFPAP